MADPPLNVWVLSAEYKPHILGGLGVVATILSREIAHLGSRVTVISSTPRSSVSITKGEDLTVVRFPKRYGTMKMAKYLADHHIPPPDIIHVHSLQYVGLQQHYKIAAKVPAVYTCHSLVLKRTNRVYTPFKQAQLLHSVDQIVVPSAMEQDKLLRRYPFCAGRTSVIAHGVNVRDIGDNPPSHKYRLLYAGRLVRGKGLEELIDAMALLKLRHPQARLFVIGNGRVLRNLKQRASRRGVAGRVHWLGRYDHGRLLNAYRGFGAVVMPSKAESFGLVALEALAAGVPLVATRVGGLGQFVNGEVAHVIERVNGPTIARVISQMWQSSSITQQRAKAGRELARSYQWSHAARSYEQMFKTMVGAR